MELDLIQHKILLTLLQNSELQSSDIHKIITQNTKLSLITVKRELAKLSSTGYITKVENGKYTKYSISTAGRLFSEIDPTSYVNTEPDFRFGQNKFNFSIFNGFPSQIFSVEEVEYLNALTNDFNQKSINLSKLLAKKELERLTIELSWKSSKIEGNTYSLLDTEKLILNNQIAVGHPQAEAKMILNHKYAFDYIWTHKKQFQKITKENLELLHSILIKDLDIANGYRKGPVGVTGSKYRPLDNVFQIEDAMKNLIDIINSINNPFDKALVTLAGISYIQPFEDGNKRTSRLLTNAILLANNLVPLSYRSVDEENYRTAMLVFYEINSIILIKEIFKEQYSFATQNYALNTNLIDN